ncbi:hypothetical protein JKP88DRAFT_347375 [Tribonema minus]|uniref:Uncharacterized protein n=1 Tax=Tribonema minus TaxID=303371 RepID=A0A836CQG7_9STRA|nr:hypothetical protein JKP88DRAFT_347375 [Tribonema minus]
MHIEQGGADDAADEFEVQFAELQSALPSFEWADQTQPVRLRRLLSDAQMDQVHNAAQELKGSCGRSVRDADGVYKVGEDGTWRTTYLHTGHAFQRALPELYAQLIAAAYEADRRENWGLLAGRDVRARCIEYHEVEPGGALADRDHRDTGSLVTIDVMLADPGGGDFSGGHFHAPVTLRGASSTSTSNRDAHEQQQQPQQQQQQPQQHPQQQPQQQQQQQQQRQRQRDHHDIQHAQTRAIGDGTAHVHTLPRSGGSADGSTQQFTGGTEGGQVEFTKGDAVGEERQCAHRCVRPFGACGYTAAYSKLEALFKSSFGGAGYEQ